MLVFIGIWVWAWLPHHKRKFDALARMPMRTPTRAQPVTGLAAMSALLVRVGDGPGDALTCGISSSSSCGHVDAHPHRRSPTARPATSGRTACCARACVSCRCGGCWCPPAPFSVGVAYLYSVSGLRRLPRSARLDIAGGTAARHRGQRCEARGDASQPRRNLELEQLAADKPAVSIGIVSISTTAPPATGARRWAITTVGAPNLTDARLAVRRRQRDASWPAFSRAATA